MKCEKSFKRVMITRWGMRQHYLGRDIAAVKQDMRAMMNKTTEQVKALLETTRKHDTV